MKKIISTILIISMMTVLAVGCQMENVASGTPESDGRAVSGSAAMSDSDMIDGKYEGDGLKWYANSDNQYYFHEDGSLIQCRLDGSRVKKIKLDAEDSPEVGWVTDQWIYYRVIDKKQEDVLWRIPIEKTGKGDHLLTQKSEKICAAPGQLSVDYVSDTCLILEIEDCDEECTALYRYDLAGKKLRQLLDESSFWDLMWSKDYPLLMEGDLFVESTDDDYETTYLSRLDPETGKLHQIGAYAAELSGADEWLQKGDLLWILADNTLYRYSGRNDKFECVIPEECFQSGMEKLRRGAMIYGEVGTIYLDNGRFYFPVRIRWQDKDQTEKSSGKASEYEKTELFSAPVDDLSSLCYESGIMDSLVSGDEESVYGEYKEGEYFHTGEFCNITDRKIYYHYEKNKNKKGEWEQRYVVYDCDSGEKKDLTKKELSEKELQIFDLDD